MEKIYVGFAKEKESQYGTYIEISFSKDDIKKLSDNLNEKGWVNTMLTKRKEVSEKGVSHTITIKQPKEPQKYKTDPDDEEITIENLPF